MLQHIKIQMSPFKKWRFFVPVNKNDNWKTDENFNPVFTKNETKFIALFFLSLSILLGVLYFIFFLKPFSLWISNTFTATLTTSDLYTHYSNSPSSFWLTMIIGVFITLLIFSLFSKEPKK